MTISKEVNIRMREKLADGTYMAKYPKTKVENVAGAAKQADLAAHLADDVHGNVSFNSNLYEIVVGEEQLIKIKESYSVKTSVERLTTIGDYIYALGYLGKTIDKFDKTNLDLVAQSDDLGVAITIMKGDGEYLYADEQTNYSLRKFDTALNVVATSSSPYNGSQITAIVCDYDFIYIAGRIQKIVRKLNKTNLAKVADSASVLNSEVYCMEMDDTYLYVGSNYTLTKLNKSDLSLVATSTTFDRLVSCITQDADYIYAGSTTTDKGRTILKIRKTDLTLVKESQYLKPMSVNYTLNIKGDFIYVGGNQGIIKKLNKHDLSVVGTSEYYGDGSDSQTTIRAICVDNDDIYIAGGGQNKGNPIWQIQEGYNKILGARRII